MRSDLFHLYAEWGPRRETAEACAWRLSRMLNDLTDVHRGFAQMVVEPNWRLSRPAGALTNRAADIVPFLSPLRLYDWGRKRIVVDGYRLNASAALTQARFLTMAIVAGAPEDDRGSRFTMNRVSVSFNILDDGNDDDATALAAVNPILLALISAWEPQTAQATSTRYGRLSRTTSNAAPFTHGIWTAYLAPGTKELSLTSLGITHRLADGGLLWCATDEVFDLDNPVHLGAAAAMHAALSRK
jgi:hypothetical protein